MMAPGDFTTIHTTALPFPSPSPPPDTHLMGSTHTHTPCGTPPHVSLSTLHALSTAYTSIATRCIRIALSPGSQSVSLIHALTTRLGGASLPPLTIQPARSVRSSTCVRMRPDPKPLLHHAAGSTSASRVTPPHCEEKPDDVSPYVWTPMSGKGGLWQATPLTCIAAHST